MKSRSVSPACTQYSRGWCSKQISLRISVSFCSASMLVMMSGTVWAWKMRQLERRLKRARVGSTTAV
ncbi:hypothetical protein PFLU3_43200 [Pseudomonas fluorescens]|uniref:Uncharacterized protein n=1 Tax=Pseudomonas fluorescens TaxID=294 RepID=A0A0D0SDG7_PSEFL|nr:hypothetical protein PFLU3_43200 [Pseudomonas fluorescens]